MPARRASELAEAGARAWREAACAQRSALADHGEFYGLAGELVATLRALESLADVLVRQVATYGQGRALRDDEDAQPAARLASAVADLTRVRELLSGAERAANRFWSEIGHVAVEEEL
ncbi:MAG: hypothetical protein M3Z25_20940 [Actinomycetota bacterium]|nr:hypothetical protein [Actinomycetota bacterium]